MADCFLHGNGYNLLNYRVKAYATEALLDADKLYENTIGVVTDVEITRHVFDSVQPSGEEGVVWFGTADASTLTFNALKKDDIRIHPKECRQYISGEWVEKTAKIYQNGKWLPWHLYLWNRGDTKDDITGGWEYVASPPYEGGEVTIPVLKRTYADGSIELTAVSGKGGVYRTRNKIDLSKFNTIELWADLNRGKAAADENNCMFCVWGSEPDDYYCKNVVASRRGEHLDSDGIFHHRHLIDVSTLEREYYFGFGIYGSDATLIFKSLRLEAATIQEVTASDS